MKLTKRTAAALALLTVFLLYCASCSSPYGGRDDSGKLFVCASVYPIYDFALKIGGDKANVIGMVPSGTEPHDWEPAPGDIAALEEADVFVYNGLGLEHWVNDVLNSLENKSLAAAQISDGILPDDTDGEHEHGHHDPHIWLNPAYAKRQMENIKIAFAEADPDNAQYYQANYDKYAEQFETLDSEFKAALDVVSRRDIIVSHTAFGHLCAAYGLNQIGVEGLMPHSEPDPATLAEIIQLAKESGATTVFFEGSASPDTINVIAQASDTQVDTLYSLETLSDAQMAVGGDYFTIMRQNLNALVNALG